MSFKLHQIVILEINVFLYSAIISSLFYWNIFNVIVKCKGCGNTSVTYQTEKFLELVISVSVYNHCFKSSSFLTNN